jgi:undecaprenyl-diphosphatase
MMALLTHLGGAPATLGAGLALLVVGQPRLGAAVLIANAASHLAVQVIKRLVGRPRPCDAAGRPLALVALPDPYSFPSGHAAASAAVALTSTLAHPPAGVVLLPLAALVASSRVTLRVHHTSDALAGALLGVAGAVLAAQLVL